MISALRHAGFDTGGATYTGNLSAALTARGWARVAADGHPRRGDILLNDADHVAVWLGDCLAQASIDEHGNIAGGARGDQTGWEVNTREYYEYPWDCYLRYGEDDDDMAAIDVWSYKNEDVNGDDDAYQVLTDIRDAVTGGGVASWDYKNRSMNGGDDTYQILTDIKSMLAELLSRK